MTKIAIIGASGKIGQRTTLETLVRGLYLDGRLCICFPGWDWASSIHPPTLYCCLVREV